MYTYNPATQPSNELNNFTMKVRQFSLFSNPDWSGYRVKLRNGMLVQPEFKEAEDENCEDAFFAEGYRYCWNLDGTSVTNPEYDMMEFTRIHE